MTTTKRPLPLAETLTFVAGVLPARTLRILEVGAGDGALAETLARDGHHVTALDRSAEAAAAARARGGFEVVEGDFLEYEAPPFDALLFTRSLHHLHPLAAAVDRARRLLVPDGLLAIEDFAFDRADRATAEWLAGEERRLRAAGMLATDEEPLLEGDALASWRAHHRETHSVHEGGEMLRAIEAGFELRQVTTGPYLHRYLHGRLGGPRAEEAGRALLESECDAIGAGRIQAVGLRVVARPRAHVAPPAATR